MLFSGCVNCSGPGFALHSDIVMPYISHFGTPEQIKKYIQCCLLITFANSLDPDQAQRCIRPDLDPNCLTL